ncbi:MAG: DUF4293 domain-containing protein [Dysgonamonadaceae bacterium]|jgi:hypothetical protein|nr:DUF4293 domain-containing protein [Dysgonamonadaceae bacterium]
MIQRIQTIWLLAGAIIASLLLFVPALEQKNVDLLLKAGSGGVVVLSIIAVFLYKNRPLQVKLCYGILVLLILSCLVLFLSGTTVAGKWPIVLPFISGIFNILAIRAIKKDEKLIRSLDRLR